MKQWFSRLALRQPSKYQAAVAVYPQRVHIAILRQGEQPELMVNDDIEVTHDEFAAAISILLERYKRFLNAGTRVQVVLSAHLVSQTTIERPALSDEELLQGLPWAVKDLIEIPPADMQVDYYEPVLAQHGRRKLHIVAVSRLWLQRLLSPLHDANLDIQGVVNEDIALLALLSTQHAPQILLTCTSSKDIELLLVKDKALVVSRILKASGVPSQQSGSQQTDQIDIDMLAIELQRSMDYFSGQLRQAPLQEIWLALPGAKVPELSSQLEQSLSMRVEQLPHPGWVGELTAGDYSDIGALAGLVMLVPELNTSLQQEVI